ncbi:hypothetical protein ACLB2K_021315 [Fragaria x ananassa]
MFQGEGEICILSLRRALRDERIKTFMDNRDTSGNASYPTLKATMEDSWFAIVVLSVKYADSTRSLDELAMIWGRVLLKLWSLLLLMDRFPLTSTLPFLQPEDSNLINKHGWFHILKRFLDQAVLQVCHVVEDDLLIDLTEVPTIVCVCVCHPIKFHQPSHKPQQIIKHLDVLAWSGLNKRSFRASSPVGHPVDSALGGRRRALTFRRRARPATPHARTAPLPCATSAVSAPGLLWRRRTPLVLDQASSDVEELLRPWTRPPPASKKGRRAPSGRGPCLLVGGVTCLARRCGWFVRETFLLGASGGVGIIADASHELGPGLRWLQLAWVTLLLSLGRVSKSLEFSEVIDLNTPVCFSSAELALHASTDHLVSQLSSLRTIFLELHSISNFPDWFFNTVINKAEKLGWYNCPCIIDVFVEYEKGRLHSLKQLKVSGEDDLMNTSTWVPKEPVFENLEELYLRMLDCAELCAVEFLQPGSLCNLKLLNLSSCYNWGNVLLPSTLLQRLPNLEELTCDTMDEIEYVFGYEALLETDQSKLRKIVLSDLVTIRSLCEGPAPPAMFQNLQSLSITDCNLQGSLFTYDVAQCLSQLNRLKLHNCPLLKMIVEPSSKKIILPKLKKLTLTELPVLYYESATFDIECPSLEKLKLWDCPKFSVSVPQVFNCGTAPN